MTRSSGRAILCFYAALCLTLWGVLANIITFAPRLRLAMALSAVSFSVSALALVGIGWSGMSINRRVLSVVMGLAALWTIVDGAGRQLPAMLGW
jgi:hypothetical protein